MATVYTNHGKARVQQRSIPDEVLELIQDLGQVQRSHGADRYYLNKKGRAELQRAIRYSDLPKGYERYLNVYVVVSGRGAIITAGRRTKRFKRDLKSYFKR